MSESGMMAPGEINLLTGFVSNGFCNPQCGSTAGKRKMLDQVKWGADRPYIESDFNFFRGVPYHRIGPGQQQNLAVLADVCSLVQRSRSAIWEHLLPSALVIVEMRA